MTTEKTNQDHGEQAMSNVPPIIPFPEPEILESKDAFRRERKRDIGRGQLPRRMRKPVIYFAGRMDGCKHGDDWRNAVEGFDGLYLADVESSAKGGPDYCEAVIDCGLFWYGGPFVIGGTGGHTSGHTAFAEEHQEIWDIDKFQIERADLIIAYIDDAQAYGTLVEIGFAAAKGKPIALGFSDSMKRHDYDELWLCRMPASKVYWGSPGEVWRWARSDWIFG